MSQHGDKFLTKRTTGLDQAVTIYSAAAIQDAAGIAARPGAVAVRAGEILAAGATHEVFERAGPATQVVDLPRSMLLPLMVNAHAHLDLTGMGRRPYSGEFSRWLRMVVAEAPRDELSIRKGVLAGLEMSRDSGVGWVGDIARTPSSLEARLGPGSLPGVSFMECFGSGISCEETVENLWRLLEQSLSGFKGSHAGPFPHGDIFRHSNVRLGLQPHAPYSASKGLYQAAAALARERVVALATHLAETPEELEFLDRASGPLADLLHDLGKWDDSIQPTGEHPIDWLEPVLRSVPWVLAHCNYVEPRHAKALARCGASVAYCPIASDYFGHHPKGSGTTHPYRALLDAGVNVCLGTDSVICQDPHVDQPLGILPAMRFLFRRDRTDPSLLLAMATARGLKALGFPQHHATLAPAVPARFGAVQINPEDPTEPLIQVLTNDQAMSPVIDNMHGQLSTQ